MLARMWPGLNFRLVLPFRFASTTSRPAGKLAGRVALVTAGTRGTGFAMAKRLAEDGAKVAICSRVKENVERAEAGLKDAGHEALGVVCNVGNMEDRQKLLQRIVSEFGSLDILVQHAGVNPHPFNILDTPDSVIDKVCDLHIKSNFQMVREVLPYMSKSKFQGSIILTSTYTAYIADMFPGIYSASKAAIISLVRAFMPELLKRNIRINCVTLGTFDTEFLCEVKKNDKLKAKFLDMIPMHRMGRPEEIGGLVSFLSSDDASFITGENYAATGGVFTRF